ncbi:gas vesicle protein [Methylocystis bryophila]|uniref:Gas vesicle protein n=1 Tax=Methylocystis bryophila TaxID=655015 RepID=A0A1W6MY13_9HYPH|nr:gas vesicle protein [Methylocystis bryophila]ARN82429.1 gas vesicle protein [Methylocystis bryophila]BDV38611.1 gas vesicle structural protein [Methylocystis bryophila]
MNIQHQPVAHSLESTNLADLLERILDKGVVIAGDISVKLVDVELLTIQLRLVVCSVDKARELGLDWWNHNGRREGAMAAKDDKKLGAMEKRLDRLETALGAVIAAPHKEGSATNA